MRQLKRMALEQDHSPVVPLNRLNGLIGGYISARTSKEMHLHRSW
jgi:hypothetical protein